MNVAIGRRTSAVMAGVGAAALLLGVSAAPAQAFTYYENCAAAQAAGAAPVYRGQDGYGDHLDRDGDGVGCEWSSGGGSSTGGASTTERPAMDYQTQITLNSVVAEAAGVRVSGTVLRTLNDHPVSAGGLWLSLEALQGSTWVRSTEQVLVSYPGTINWPVRATYPSGTQLRLAYSGDTLPFPFTDPAATSAVLVMTGGAPATAPTATTPRTAVVKVKAIGGRSKIRVDVNPNKGSGYWMFRVQRLNGDGATWTTLPRAYKTKGSKETRTVNLPKGTYRVIVDGKYEYAGSTSAAVSLKR